MDRKHALMIDGSNLVARCFAIAELRGYEGEQLIETAHRMTAASLGAMMREQHAEVTVVAMDHGRTFRHRLLESYKGNRKDKGEEHRTVRRKLPETCELLGAKAYHAIDFEADDVLATLALRAHGQGWGVTIASDDQDLWQIAKPGMRFLWCRRILGETEMRERYPFPIERLPLYKALAGDASDNIGGVREIGGKTASKIAARYATTAELFDQLHQLDHQVPKLRKGTAERIAEAGQETIALYEQVTKIALVDHHQLIRAKEELSKIPPADASRDGGR